MDRACHYIAIYSATCMWVTNIISMVKKCILILNYFVSDASVRVLTNRNLIILKCELILATDNLYSESTPTLAQG